MATQAPNALATEMPRGALKEDLKWNPSFLSLINTIPGMLTKNRKRQNKIEIVSANVSNFSFIKRRAKKIAEAGECGIGIKQGLEGCMCTHWIKLSDNKRR